ncbi:MAG TPA: GAF domain-containing sensor histidine kinase [Anaeromyxobacteraceae bacterium]|nr:GAF domain-containing sensor histidine kinase [Anaeromyxobacteraceae bacterium]
MHSLLRSEADLVRSDIAALLQPEPVVADELAARVTQAQALAELGEIAAHAQEPDGLVRVAVHLVARGLDAALVAFVEPDGEGALRVRAATRRDLVDVLLERPGSLAAEALETGAPATSELLPFDDARLTATGLTGAICVPLSGAPHALGVLCACATRRSFDASEIQFLQICANVLAGYLARHAAMREMQEMQARLALADRLFASATVAAGLAHEINNPLAVVTSNLAWIEEALTGVMSGGAGATAELREGVVEAITDARNSAARMRDLVRDLRALTRVDDAGLAAVPLAPLVKACARIVSAEIAGRARIVLDVADAPPVHANEARLGQVFLNLLVNAAQAIAPGRPDSNEIGVTARQLGSTVCIEVRDTGRGIAPAQLARLFEPFFTTVPAHGAARGRGLGLAICHQIVTSIGGEIEVESTVGRGSTFRVLLRVAPSGTPAGNLARP